MLDLGRGVMREGGGGDVSSGITSSRDSVAVSLSIALSVWCLFSVTGDRFGFVTSILPSCSVLTSKLVSSDAMLEILLTF